MNQSASTTVVILDAQSGKRVAGIDVDLSTPPTVSLLLPVGEYKAEFRNRDASVAMVTTPFEVSKFPNQTGNLLVPTNGEYGLTVRSMEWADINKA